MKEPTGSTGHGIICPHCDKMIPFEMKEFDKTPFHPTHEYSARHLAVCPLCRDIFHMWVKK